MGGSCMFGFILSNTEELTPQQKDRYQQVYCGICRNIRKQSSGLARLGLSFDISAFSDNGARAGAF